MRPNDTRLADLMRAAQTGDTNSYEELLGEIAQLVRRAVRRQRPYFSTEEAEDVVQDVLMSVHAVRVSYDPDRPSRRGTNEIVVDEVDVTFSSEEANPSDEEYRDSEELRRAIATLPAGQRR